VREELLRLVLQPRLGHWLGMRLRDVGDYRLPLRPGAVITVEPGVYLPEA